VPRVCNIGSLANGKWDRQGVCVIHLETRQGQVEAPLDPNTAVDFTESYLLVFEEEVKKAKDPDSLINAMKE
jgi:hypothetical protein